MKLPIIQGLWIGDDFSNIEKLCAQSFIDNGHEFHLYTYDKVGGIPDGVIVKDGNDILPRSEIFQYKSGSFAGFADWFRYALLVKHGGIWVDMDNVCLKPFDFSHRELMIAGTELVGCTNSIIAAPPNNPLMKVMEKICAQTPNKQGAPFASIGGPTALANEVNRMGLLGAVKPFYYFRVFSAANWYMPFDKTFADAAEFLSSCYSVHLFNEMLRRAGFDKSAVFDSASLFEKLKAKHHIANHSDKKITPAEVRTAFQSARTVRIARQKNRKKKRNIILAAIFIVLVLGNIIGWSL